MSGIKRDEMRKITEEVEAEFPNDPALQQIHIARKIMSAEAKRKGLSLFEYIKSLRPTASGGKTRADGSQ